MRPANSMLFPTRASRIVSKSFRTTTHLSGGKMTSSHLMMLTITSIQIKHRTVIKDRQQEVRAVLVGLRYIGDYYMTLGVQHMYYVPLCTLLYGRFIDIKHVRIT